MSTKPATRPAMSEATLKRVEQLIVCAAAHCAWMKPSGYPADALEKGYQLTETVFPEALR